jgi:hypothetical protein
MKFHCTVVFFSFFHINHDIDSLWHLCFNFTAVTCKRMM